MYGMIKSVVRPIQFSFILHKWIYIPFEYNRMETHSKRHDKMRVCMRTNTTAMFVCVYNMIFD